MNVFNTESKLIGRIHSIMSGGMVDGPGIRTVVFFQGCLGRCLYCHNPDSWELLSGKPHSVDALFEEIKTYKVFFDCSGGGVTFSGGEPLLQPLFLKALLERCQQEKIHTALDTSGFADWEEHRDLFNFVDLVLLDIKSLDDQIHQRLTGLSNERTLALLSYLASIKKDVWIRYPLIPHINDDEELLKATAKFLKSFKNISKVEVLPLHQLGFYKWELLGMDNKLKNHQIPNHDMVQHAQHILNFLL